MTTNGLRLISSDRLEVLARDLAHRIHAAPRPPLDDEVVVVGSRGMARWLHLFLAEEHGVAASIESPFPFTWARRTVDQVFGRGGDPGDDPFGAGRLPWRVHELLGRPDALDGDAADHAPLARYLDGDDDGRRRGQLALRLARQFVNYQSHRPRELRRWESGQWFGDEPLDALGERWQAALWRTLVVEGAPDVPLSTALHDALRRLGQDDPPPGLPPRLTVFGVSSLPPTVLTLLQAVARHAEVTVATLDPSAHHIGITETTRRPRFDDVAPEHAHPLLAAWGTLGIELQEQLLSTGEETDVDARFEERPATTLLERVQADLFAARLPETKHPFVDDRSLRVHLCHSERREIEVLRDEILRAFEDGVVTSPADVLVLVPDVERYAPYVRAVFESERPTSTGALALPVRIADGRDADEDGIARLALLLLERTGGRATATELLEILDAGPVARRFGLDTEEPAALRDLVRRAGIRAGRDPEERERTRGVPAGDGGTWREGLDRMVLGVALGPVDATIDGVVPLGDATTGRGETIGRLARAVDHVFEQLHRLVAPRPLSRWCADLRDALHALTRFDAADDLARRADFVAALDALAEQSVDDPSVARSTFVAALRARLEDDAAGRGFVSGRITVAELRPMRSLPYRMIAVAGLDADTFPRRDPAEGLDLIAARRRAGERTARLDDRQMLLEVLTAARERLVLSAVGFDPHDNRERARSVCLDELAETLDHTFALEDPPTDDDAPSRRITVVHRLQPFHPIYGDPAAAEHFTYDGAVVAGARALRGRAAAVEPFVDTVRADDGLERDADGRVVVALDDLVRFWRHPSRWYVRDVLGLALHHAEEDLDREGLGVENLVTWRVRQHVLDAGTASFDPAALADGIDRAHALVSGASGRLQARMKIDEALVRWDGHLAESGERARREVDLVGENWRVRGTLDVDPEQGLCELVANGDARPDVLVATWIRHVVFGATRKADDPVPWISTLRPAKAAVKGWAGGADAPHDVVDALVAGYVEGQTRPLRFYPATTSAWWKAVADRDTDAPSVRRGAWAAVAGTWQSDFGGGGDGTDEAVRLCTRGLDDPVDDDFVRWARLFAEAFETVLGDRELKKARKEATG